MADGVNERDAKRGAPSPWARLWEPLRTQRANLASGAAFLAVSSACAGGIPRAVSAASNALNRGDRSVAVTASLVIAALAAVGAWARVESRVRIFNAGRDAEYLLRERLLSSLHRLGPSFYRRMSPGEIMSRATNDLAQVRLLVGFGALNVVNTLFAYAVNIPMMFARNAKLAALALLPFPFFILLTQAFARVLFERSRAAQEALGAMSDRVQRVLSGMRVVRAYGVDGVELKGFDGDTRRSLEANLALARLRGSMFPILGLGAALSSLVVVWYGARTIITDPGAFSVGDILAFQGHVALVAWPTIAMGYLLSIVQRGKVSIMRVAEVLDATPDIDDARAAPVAPADLEGALHVEGLRYEIEGRAVLDGVSLDVPAGGSLAVVGRTGAGKSVLVRLLARALPTPEGAVFLDGRDVTTVPLATLRAVVGVAQQEPFLFSTTVARNVAFAEPDPDAPETVERVRAALREAELLDEIDRTPDGIYTIVGERGVQLSGGQKQRVALARALLTAPRVLLLDDPLSAVDARTEAAILDAIDRVSQGRTLVLVTHRVAAAARCDRVVVLDEGRVVESGTHDELVRRGGLYARMAERQSIEAELEAL